MATKVALVMLLVAFTSGVVLSATHGPLRQTMTLSQTMTLTKPVTSWTTSMTVSTSTVKLTHTTVIVTSPSINVTLSSDGIATIEGKGFRPSSNITITVDGLPMNTTLSPVQSNSAGGFIAYSATSIDPHTKHLFAANDSENNAAIYYYNP